MASSTIAWMPSRGRYKINIGPSLGRAIKTRKLKGSPPTTKRSNLPDRDFYAFRYNFKPGAIDTTKPASIEVKKGPENTQILADFPSKELNEVCTYSGTEIPAKEVECILIYDEETRQYTLEKLDSVVSLQFGGKRAAATSAPSPASEPSASSTPSIMKGKAKQVVDDDELERLLLSEEDHRGPQMDKKASLREEEEEGEEVDIPLQSQVPKRPPPSTIPKNPTKPIIRSKEINTHTMQLPHSSSISVKSMTTSSSKVDKPPRTFSSVVPPPKPPKSSPKQAKRTRPAPPPVVDAPLDEEIIEERPSKRPRTLAAAPSRQPQMAEPPIPKPPVELALPGGPSTFVTLPAPSGSMSSKKATNTNLAESIPITVPPGVSATITMEEVLGDEEDDDDEWEAVPTPAPLVPPPSQHEYDRLEHEIFAGFGDDEEQEIDVNAFEAELNEQMEMEEDGDEDDDDDMEDVMPEAMSGAGRPISLNRLASGMMDGESDEDYSSSDSDSD